LILQTAEILRFALDRTVQGFAQNDSAEAFFRSLFSPASADLKVGATPRLFLIKTGNDGDKEILKQFPH
jgi:hypothetical protein